MLAERSLAAQVAAQVVGLDPRNNLAIIKVEGWNGSLSLQSHSRDLALYSKRGGKAKTA